MSLKLFHAEGSCALAALIALELAEADYEPIAIDLAGGAQRGQAFRALNPLGRVPVLLVGDTPVAELIAVLTYVAHAHPEAGLLPFDESIALARCYERLSWFATNVHITVAQITRGERFSDDAAVREQLKAPGRERLRAHLAQLDRELAIAGPWLAGDRFTIADALTPVMSRWAERFEIPTDDLMHWRRAVTATRALPAVLRALDIEAGTPTADIAEDRTELPPVAALSAGSMKLAAEDYARK